MKELDLYLFITENNIEYHWHDEDVIMFVDTSDVEQFNKMLGSHILDEHGIECRMKEGYFCFDMKDICDHFDIDMARIYTNKNA